MTHLGITEQRDGTAVHWMEAVSDEQYDAALASPQSLPQRPAQPGRVDQPAPPSNGVKPRVQAGT
jgi:hypothetical protein